MSMAPRGEVVLVIATLGYQQGHVSHHVLVALILMTIAAAVLAPLLMVSLAQQRTRRKTTADSQSSAPLYRSESYEHEV